jgi:PKD repeat protein
MKNYFLFSLLLLLLRSNFANADNCEWNFQLNDSNGDGWNGSTLIIKQNGIPIDTLTLNNGFSGDFHVAFTEGADIQFVFTTGSYNSECSFVLNDNVSATVYSSPVGLIPGEVYSFEAYCACEANATFVSQNYGLTVHFFNNEIDTSAFNFYWSFGDTSLGLTNVSDPVHSYSLPGNYTVSLIVTQAGDTICSDTSLIVLSVDSCLANGAFTYQDSAYAFDFSTLFAYDTTLFNIDWDFGDGFFDTGSPVNHVFLSAGFYPVQCTVSSIADSTCSADFTQLIQVGNCNISAGYSYYNDGFNASFYPNYSFGNYTALWDFGDGTTSTMLYPVHTFPTIGYYTVSLTLVSVSNPFCYEMISQLIYIDGCVAGQFNVEYSVVDNTITLIANMPAGITGYSFDWDLGDGTVITNQDTVVYTYAEPGIYNVMLTVQSLNDSNCTSGMMSQVQVWGPCPVTGPLGFTFTDDMDLNFVFTADSSYTNPYVGYYWDFGDGFYSSAGYSVEHTFMNAGTYNVTLYVGHMYMENCYDSLTIQIDAFDCEADANFTYNVNGANPLIYYFHSPVTYNFSEYSSLWDFGNGFTVPNTNVTSFVFPSPGIYPVSFSVSNIGHVQCLDSKTDTINLCNMLVDFSFQTDNLSFSASTLYDPSQYIINWDFGDGETATGVQTVDHEYAMGGTYEVCVSVTSMVYSTCSFETCHSVSVAPNGISELPWSRAGVQLYPNPALENLSVEFASIGNESILYQIVSATGQIVSEGKLNHLKKSEINVSSLQHGLYFLKLSDDSGEAINLKFLR